MLRCKTNIFPVFFSYLKYTDNVSIWYSVLTRIFMFHFIMQRWNHWTWNAHLLSSVFAGQLPYFAWSYEIGGQYRHLFNAIHEPRWIQSLKGSYQFTAHAVYRVFCCITTPYHTMPYHTMPRHTMLLYKLPMTEMYNGSIGCVCVFI